MISSLAILKSALPCMAQATFCQKKPLKSAQRNAPESSRVEVTFLGMLAPSQGVLDGKITPPAARQGAGGG